jgi:hypothetical protein
MAAVRRHCQTMALYSGFPVRRSQITVVSDGGDVGRFEARLSQHFSGRAKLGLPDRFRVVFHPARLWEELGELLLLYGDDPPLVIKQNSPRTRGSLI